MKIQILGTGCPKCRLLKSNTQQAVTDLGIDVEVEEVTDMETMMDLGMLVSPGFAVDDTLLHTGKVLSVDQIKTVVREHAEEGAPS